MGYHPHETQIEKNWEQFLKQMEHLVHEFRKLNHTVTLIQKELKPKVPVKGIITQGVNMPVIGTIAGLLPGQSDVFFLTPVDVNGNPDALPAGSPIPTITADDPTVTVVTNPDGLGCTATAAAGATPGGSFNLNWAASYTKPDGTVANITATAQVPILTPPALLPVGGVFSQGQAAAAVKK